MKISLLTKSFMPISGGAERYAMQLAQGLAQVGHEIHVFCPEFQGPIPTNIQYHPIKKISLNTAKFARQEVKDSIVFSLVKTYPVDIYRAGDGVLRHWYTKKYPNPIWRFLAGYMPKHMLAMHIEYHLYNSPNDCHRIIANSHLVKKHIENYYPNSIGRIDVVHNGVNCDIFHPHPASDREQWLQQYGIRADTPVWLFVGNDWGKKGLKTLLLAGKPFLQQKNAQIVIIGKGKTQQWRTFLEKENIPTNVFFIGQSSQVPLWYAYSNAFVLPTYYDPFSNVCLEAFASGIPVVTTQDNGASEVIRNGENGYVLQDAKDHVELGHILEKLQSITLCTKLGLEALATARHCTMTENVAKTLEILQRL